MARKYWRQTGPTFGLVRSSSDLRLDDRAATALAGAAGSSSGLIAIS
jgi:hypothetical protein